MTFVKKGGPGLMLERHALSWSLVDILAWRVAGILLIAGGAAHWLIIFGFIYEKSPLPIDILFHSFAVLSPMAGFFLFRLKKFGALLACFLALIQIPAHSYMIYLDVYQNWNSGLAPLPRLTDCVVGIIGVVYFVSFFRRQDRESLGSDRHGDDYRAMTHRNIGLLTQAQQEKLKNSCVALCGLGGIGGPVGEMLARAGVENFVLLDHGRFELTNLNRQNFCFRETIDRHKVDVTETYLKKINPAIRVRKYREVDKNNVAVLLEGVDIVALGIDSIVPVILLSRQARSNQIPLVEGWCVPMGNVRVFDKNTITLEKAYDLNLENMDMATLTEDERLELTFKTMATILNVEGAEAYATPEALENYRNKMQATTLAPLVWLTCSLMATEILKVLLGWGKIAYAPSFQVYDAIQHKVREHSINVQDPSVASPLQTSL